MRVADLAPLLILVVLGYLMIVRPVRQRARSQAQTRASLTPGSRVMTTSGLFATVVAVGSGEVTLEVAPGVTTRWNDAAIARVLPPETAVPAADAFDVAGTGSTDGGAAAASGVPPAAGADVPRPFSSDGATAAASSDAPVAPTTEEPGSRAPGLPSVAPPDEPPAAAR